MDEDYDDSGDWDEIHRQTRAIRAQGGPWDDHGHLPEDDIEVEIDCE